MGCIFTELQFSKFQWKKHLPVRPIQNLFILRTDTLVQVALCVLAMLENDLGPFKAT